MSKPQFVYVIYIASTPEKVFDALTECGKVLHAPWYEDLPLAKKAVGAAR